MSARDLLVERVMNETIVGRKQPVLGDIVFDSRRLAEILVDAAEVIRRDRAASFSRGPEHEPRMEDAAAQAGVPTCIARRFEQVLGALRDGKCIRRRAWFNPGFVLKANSRVVSAGVKIGGVFESVETPWRPGAGDLLAEDWEIA